MGRLSIFIALLQRYRLFSSGDGAVHEVLVAKGIGEEAFDGVIDHVDVGVEVERNDAAGGHEEVLSKVHHCVAVLGVGAGLDLGDENIVGLGWWKAATSFPLRSWTFW